MHTIYNALESGLWLILAAVLAWRAGNKHDGNRKRLFLIAATTFLAFGVSDLVEIQTGAWYRPWWLLAWKAICILILISCFTFYRKKAGGEIRR